MKLTLGKLAAIVLAAATIAYGLVEFRGPNGYTGLMQKREEVRRLERENQKLKEDIDRLSKRVDKLKTDPAAQELEIRKQLGLVKQGETVYVLQDSKKPAASAPAEASR